MLRILSISSILFWSVAAAAEPLPKLPDPLSSFGAVTVDGYVYVYGGHSGRVHSYSSDTTLGKFRRLNIADPSKGWEELPESTHLQGLALVGHAGQVIRIGGMEPRNKKDEKSDLHSVDTVQRFEPKTKKWTDLPSLPVARSSHDAVVIADTLYVIGGWTMKSGQKSEWHTKYLTLDLADAKATWKSHDQPFTRRALTVTAHDGKIYAIGGLTSTGDVDHSVNILDAKTQQWTMGPKIPGERMNAFTPATCSNGKLYLSPADGKIYEYTPENWKEVGKTQTARWVHRMVPWNKQMLVIGGATADGSVPTVELVLGQ